MFFDVCILQPLSEIEKKHTHNCREFVDKDIFTNPTNFGYENNNTHFPRKYIPISAEADKIFYISKEKEGKKSHVRFPRI